MDLISIVLTLRPLPTADNTHPLPLWWGRATHALLLKTIRALDENLAANLHDEDGLRPFTASNLMGRGLQRALNPAATYSLRFTGLTAPVCALLEQSIQPGACLAPGRVVDLDYHNFEISTAHSTPDTHEWAVGAAYSDLAAAHLVSTAAAERQVALLLASPTQFHSNDRTMPIPLPELVFGSLLERWNTFAPIAFPSELRRYAAECLVINRFDLHSRPVPLKNGGKRIGAVGKISYTTLNYDRYWMSLIQTLAAFSIYSGIGAGVSMGLGQARKL